MVKVIVGFVVGVVTGLAFSRIPHYLDEYEMRGTPPPYEGPKYYEFKNGVKVRL